MARRRSLPETASVALPGSDGRLFAPSAARNAEAICAMIATHAPKAGRALEIASGTGEHAVRLAARLPGLDWQPSDIEPERRASIDAWVAHAGQPNLRPSIALDACAPGWGAAQSGHDLIFASNILHLVSAEEAKTLIVEAARALAPDGLLMIYGPFLRETGFASRNDAQFHASLTETDPEIGYKALAHVEAWMRGAGLIVQGPAPMPSNNLMLIARKPR